MKTRILAILLSLAMIFSILPAQALAIEADDGLGAGAPECTCKTACTAKEKDESCSVCGAEGAELTACRWSDWTAITEEGGTLSDGNYYLAEDITLSKNLTVPYGTTVTIDLNGHFLKGNGSGNVIRLKGSTYSRYSTLIVKDSDPTATHEGKGITGGIITGGNASSGGGIYVDWYAQFTMEGGTITGNNASSGGGVYVGYRGSFAMAGGAIAGNTATSESGGGVYVDLDATFNMTGGTIENNEAKNGGGVYIFVSSNDESDEVEDDTAIIYASNSSMTPMSVNVEDSAGYRISGGTIRSNRAESGGGIYLLDPCDAKKALSVSGTASITGNQAENGGGVYLACGTMTVSGGSITGNQATTGGGIYIGESFRRYGNVTISGGTVADNTAATGAGVYVFGSGSGTTQGGTLRVTDGSIARNTATGSGGGVYLGYPSTFNMEGGTITGNTANYGGGIYAYWNTNVTMTGGAIGDNEADCGGGIYFKLGYYSTVSMISVTVSGNEADYGGGVYIESSYSNNTVNFGGCSITGNTANYNGGGVYTADYVKLKISDGEKISNNTAKYDGGGIYVGEYSTLVMDGGSLTGNKAEKGYGGGVCGGYYWDDYCYANVSASSITVTGGVLYDNLAGIGGDDLYAAEDYLTLAQVGDGWTLSRPSGKKVTGWYLDDDVARWYSGNAQEFVINTGSTMSNLVREDPSSGEEGGVESSLCIGLKAAYAIDPSELCKITFNANGGKFSGGEEELTVTILQNYPITGVEEPTKSGSLFDSWCVPDEDGKPGAAYDLTGGVTENITLVAKYTDIITITPVDITQYNIWTKVSDKEWIEIGTSANGQGNVPEIRYTIEAPENVDLDGVTFTVNGKELTVQKVGDGVYLIPTLDENLQEDEYYNYYTDYLYLKCPDYTEDESGKWYVYAYDISGQSDLTITATSKDGATYPVVLGTGKLTQMCDPDNPTTEGYSISVPESSVTTNGNHDLGVLSDTKDDSGNVSTTGFTIAPLVENTDIATNNLTDTLGGFAEKSEVKPITDISGSLQQILALVNTTDGNAAVEADVDEYTITVPYPENVMAENAGDYLYQVLIFDGYDVSNTNNQTVAVSEIGTVDITATKNGLQFTLDSLDAPFVVLAKEKTGVSIIPQNITAYTGGTSANGSNNIPELRFAIDVPSKLNLEDPTYTVTKDGETVDLSVQGVGEGTYLIPKLEEGLTLEETTGNYVGKYLTLKKISGDDEATVYKITLNDGVTFAIDGDDAPVSFVSGAKVTVKTVPKDVTTSGYSISFPDDTNVTTNGKENFGVLSDQKNNSGNVETTGYTIAPLVKNTDINKNLKNTLDGFVSATNNKAQSDDDKVTPIADIAGSLQNILDLVNNTDGNAVVVADSDRYNITVGLPKDSDGNNITDPSKYEFQVIVFENYDPDKGDDQTGVTVKEVTPTLTDDETGLTFSTDGSPFVVLAKKKAVVTVTPKSIKAYVDGDSANGSDNIPELRYGLTIPSELADSTITVTKNGVTKELLVQEIGTGTYLIWVKTTDDNVTTYSLLDAGLTTSDNGQTYSNDYLTLTKDSTNSSDGETVYKIALSQGVTLELKDKDNEVKFADNATVTIKSVPTGANIGTQEIVPGNGTKITTNGNANLGVIGLDVDGQIVYKTDSDGNKTDELDESAAVIVPIIKSTYVTGTKDESGSVAKTLTDAAEQSKVTPITDIYGNVQNVEALVNATDGNAVVKADGGDYTITVDLPKDSNGNTITDTTDYKFQVLVFENYDPDKSTDGTGVTVKEVTPTLTEDKTGLTFPTDGSPFVVLAVAKSTVTVTFDANGGSFGTDSTGNTITTKELRQKEGTVDFSDLTLCTIPTRTGYVFTGWYSDKDAKQRLGSGVQVSTNTTVYAGWAEDKADTVENTGAEQVSLTLVYDPLWQWIGSGTPDVVMYFPTGTQINMSTLVVPGHEDDKDTSWTKGSGTVETRITEPFILDKDTTIYAEVKLSGELGGTPGGSTTEWKTLSYVTNGGTMPSGEAGNSYSASYESTATVDLTKTSQIPTKAGYTFGGWYDNESLSGKAVTEVKMDNDKTVYAKWLVTLTLVYDQAWQSSGTGTADVKIAVEAGTTVDLTKLVISGHEDERTTIKWYEEAELKTEITQPFTMNEDKTVYAGTSLSSTKDDDTKQQTPTPTTTPDLNTEEHIAYIIGYGDGSVHPEEYISRAEVATIFYRLLTDDVREENKTDKNTFDDVDEAKWYNTAVSTMQALGIVNGRTSNTFAPNANITRAEFAAICVRFAGGTTDKRGSFSDISNHWAEAQIERAVALGWIDGYPDGSFRPDQPITRAEAMKLINRVLNRNPENLTDLLNGMNVWSDNTDTDKWYYLAVQEATNSHEYERKSSTYEKWTGLVVGSIQPDKKK